jgi:hypothetical protein
MQTSSSLDPNIDDVSLAGAGVEAGQVDLSASLPHAEKASERIVQHLGKPAVVAGLAVVALATVAGVTIALARRKRSNAWLQPERPSALGTAARGAGMFLLRLAARQVATQLLTRLDAAPPPAANERRSTDLFYPAQ